MDMESYYEEWGDRLLEGYERGVEIHPEKILVVGMGGSGIVGHIARDIASLLGLEVEVEVENTPELPGSRGLCKTLVLISHSGNTLETLEAGEKLWEKSVEVVAISTGGRLLKEAERRGWVKIKVEAAPLPRLGLPQMLGPLLRILGIEREMVDEASRELRTGMGSIREEAGELADWLGEKDKVYTAPATT